MAGSFIMPIFTIMVLPEHKKNLSSQQGTRGHRPHVVPPLFVGAHAHNALGTYNSSIGERTERRITVALDRLRLHTDELDKLAASPCDSWGHSSCLGVLTHTNRQLSVHHMQGYSSQSLSIAILN